VRQLTVFNNVTLDGYIADAKSDMSWAHQSPTDAEWNAFVSGNAQGGGALLFGRVTYDLMASFWPTPAAAAAMPAVAEGMNRMPKYVFSRTMTKPEWQNTTVLKGDIAAATRKLKSEPGPGIVILGSGSIVAQLTAAGLIDEYQLVVHPVVLGAGKTMFAGLKEKVRFKLGSSRTFKNGNVVLSYQRAG
jgi:dihydrofolate reductase